MILNETQSNIIASSQYNFQIELIKKVGNVDGDKIIKISEELVDIFGAHSLLNEKKIHKYFQKYRIRKNKEIFKVKLEKIIEYIESIK